MDEELERRKKRVAIEEQCVHDLGRHMREEDQRIEKAKRWHFDKEVPIATIVVLLLQTVGVVWWAATISAELRNEKESRILSTAIQITTDRKQDDEKMNSEARLASRLDRIDAKLDRVAEKVMK